MSTRKDFVDYLLDQISDESARVRAMFGEYALYYEDVVVGLVCDNTVFIKITPGTKRILGEDAPTGPAYPGAKPSFILSEEYLEKREELQSLIRICADDVKYMKKQKRS